MFGIHDLTLFIIAGLLLNITPGPDVLYIVGRSAAQGFRAGTWAALGIGAGCVIHIVAAALGLSAILATSATAFTVVKWLGAIYLVYMGLTMLLAKQGTAGASPVPPVAASRSRIFWQGFLTNVLNPKVALFFLAFVPQFIESGSPDKLAAFLLLGVVFNVNATLWNIFVAWSASRLLRPFAAAPATGRWLNRVLSAFFVVLGARLAISERA